MALRRKRKQGVMLLPLSDSGNMAAHVIVAYPYYPRQLTGHECFRIHYAIRSVQVFSKFF